MLTSVVIVVVTLQFFLPSALSSPCLTWLRNETVPLSCFSCLREEQEGHRAGTEAKTLCLTLIFSFLFV